MNKCRVPKIPPLLVNNLFILNCNEKAKYFNDFFSQQCKPIVNNSVLPVLHFLTEKRTDHITIKKDEIISLIGKVNPGKATGSDGISGQMLILCDDSVILPLKIIFSNILSTSNYPNLWEVANVIPIHKKGDTKQTNYYILSMKSTRLLIVQNASKCVQCSLIFLRHLTRYGMMD